jgi:hypothetical protein
VFLVICAFSLPSTLQTVALEKERDVSGHCKIQTTSYENSSVTVLSQGQYDVEKNGASWRFLKMPI